MLDDPFDLDDHRPRVATELDSFIAAGVREAEAERRAEPEAETCPDCEGSGKCFRCDGSGEDDDRTPGCCRNCDGACDCPTCLGTRVILAPDQFSALSRAWEAAGGEGQVNGSTLEGRT